MAPARAVRCRVSSVRRSSRVICAARVVPCSGNSSRAAEAPADWHEGRDGAPNRARRRPSETQPEGRTVGVTSVTGLLCELRIYRIRGIVRRCVNQRGFLTSRFASIILRLWNRSMPSRLWALLRRPAVCRCTGCWSRRDRKGWLPARSPNDWTSLPTPCHFT